MYHNILGEAKTKSSHLQDVQQDESLDQATKDDAKAALEQHEGDPILHPVDLATTIFDWKLIKHCVEKMGRDPNLPLVFVPAFLLGAYVHLTM